MISAGTVSKKKTKTRLGQMVCRFFREGVRNQISLSWGMFTASGEGRLASAWRRSMGKYWLAGWLAGGPDFAGGVFGYEKSGGRR